MILQNLKLKLEFNKIIYLFKSGESDDEETSSNLWKPIYPKVDLTQDKDVRDQIENVRVTSNFTILVFIPFFSERRYFGIEKTAKIKNQ